MSVIAIMGALLFVAAAMYRLARWRMLRDAYSALAGTALLLVGVLAIPSRSVALLLDPGANGMLSATALRGGVCLIAMSLLLRASRTVTLRPLETPRPLLAISLLVAGVLFSAVASIEVAQGRGADAVSLAPLSILVAIGWLLLFVEMRRRATVLPWAGRAAPLLAAMGVAEALRAIGAELANGWTLAALVLTAAIGVVALRSAMADLDHATQTSRAVEQHLLQHLGTVTGEVEAHERWRSDLRHDARNTCAGLRAAFAMLENQRDALPADAVERLHRAAVVELAALEAMLTPESEPGEVFDVGEAAARAAATVRGTGTSVRLRRTGPAPSIGYADDLELVIRELLSRSCGAAGRGTVFIDIATTDEDILVRVGSRSPHTLDPADDPGLAAARHLLRRSGGDLVPDSSGVLMTLACARTPA